MINPLLEQFTLPPFSHICPEHVIPAVKNAIKHCHITIEQILAQSGCFTWDNFCQPLNEANNRLQRIWSPINHLHEVKHSNMLRVAYKTSLLLLTEYSTWTKQHIGLYKAYLSLRNNQYYTQLNLAQKKEIDNVLQDFQLHGINLSIKKQQRYGQIVARLSELSMQYSNNVLDATVGWNKLIIDKQAIIGIPESILATAKYKAKLVNKKGWLLTLDISSYLPIITYCNNAELRKEIYYAYNTRASDQGPNAKKWDNSPIINEILSLRYELANILGFKSYAKKSLETKMAQNPQQILNLLQELIKFTMTKGQRDIDQLQTFVQQNYGVNNLKPWDILYYSEKQKQHLFAIKDEHVSVYLTEQRVLNGLFEVIQRIYNVTTKECNNVDTWHPDVKFFNVFDHNGELCGSFYLDLYVRNNKRGGAWMDNCVDMMKKIDGTLQKPVAYITCNFNRSINEKQSLLTHNEVITLFHELGHGLHHILTRIDILGVSGINGVPGDAVEISSQFMENYCWQADALKLISGHNETGAPLPDELLQKLLKTKNYQISLFLLRQLEYSLFDLYIHDQYQPEKKLQIIDIINTIKKQVAVVPSMPWERFAHTFNHIFSGSYAASYYSYLWSNIMSADAWSRFEEEGIFNSKTGQSFLKNIISCGGSEDPIITFIRFRHRKPKIDTMLQHYNLLT